MVFVKYNGHSIKGHYIKGINNPSEAVCIEAVKQKGYYISYIKNPSEAVCLIAVKRYGFAIKHIKNPSEEMCLIVVKKDGCNINYILDPTEEMCLIAVKEHRYAGFYIKFTEKIQEYFISKDINNVLLIPVNKLLVKFKKKYKYLLDMKTAGIL